MAAGQWKVSWAPTPCGVPAHGAALELDADSPLVCIRAYGSTVGIPKMEGDSTNEQQQKGAERDLSHIKFNSEGYYEIEKGLVPGMKVAGRVYVDSQLMSQLTAEIGVYYQSKQTSFLPALHQIGNVASLPGVVGASIGLPDIHCGYGFAIGHVAAFDMDDPEAVVSPGGVGFDINCGVRMIRSDLIMEDLLPRQEALADAIFKRIPVGVGGVSNMQDINQGELRKIMDLGMDWAVERGYAWPEDQERCEERGKVIFKDLPPGNIINQRAEARGAPQLGTLGSGNHYIEVQKVTDIHDPAAAAAMGITRIGQICVMVHCGSRGLGHQIAKDTIDMILKKNKGEGRQKLNDEQLACVPINSPSGSLYLAQMAGASNFAYVNRSVIVHGIRQAFSEVFERDPREMGLHMVYDVAHNIAKEEVHLVEGVQRRLLVHRKGATRAFPPGHPDLPNAYKSIGQPVLVGGSMGTCSYVLTGTQKAMEETFGTTCHGAGRAMGRNAMKKLLKPEDVIADLRSKNICIRVGSLDNIAEESPESYKDVTNVVNVCHSTGISKIAFRLEPVCVIKG